MGLGVEVRVSVRLGGGVRVRDNLEVGARVWLRLGLGPWTRAMADCCRHGRAAPHSFLRSTLC